MTISKTVKGDYLAIYKGKKASGYTIAQAIINWLTLYK